MGTGEVARAVLWWSDECKGFGPRVKPLPQSMLVRKTEEGFRTQVVEASDRDLTSTDDPIRNVTNKKFSKKPSTKRFHVCGAVFNKINKNK